MPPACRRDTAPCRPLHRVVRGRCRTTPRVVSVNLATIAGPRASDVQSNSHKHRGGSATPPPDASESASGPLQHRLATPRFTACRWISRRTLASAAGRGSHRLRLEEFQKRRRLAHRFTTGITIPQMLGIPSASSLDRSPRAKSNTVSSGHISHILFILGLKG